MSGNKAASNVTTVLLVPQETTWSGSVCILYIYHSFGVVVTVSLDGIRIHQIMWESD